MTEQKKMTEQDIITMFPNIPKNDKVYIKALCEYYDIVANLSTEDKTFEFNNKDMYHASIVMSAIFSKAKEYIKIYAGDFNGDVCGNKNYLNSLKDAFYRGVKIDIIFENNPKTDSEGFKLMRELRSINGKNVTISQVSEEFKQINKIDHFMIADGLMFRYEVDKQAYKAFCNFDDRITSEVLLKNFEIISTHSALI